MTGIASLALGLLAMAPAGSRPGDVDQARRRAPVDLAFTITDAQLQGPRTASAGHVVLHVNNAAAQPHQVALWLLPPNRNRQQVIDSMRASGRAPQGLVQLGGIGPLPAGHKGSLLMRLPPGEYIVYCTLNGPHGDPWFKHGAMTTLDVTGEPDPNLPYETAYAGIMMSDARIMFVQTVQRGNRRVLIEGLRPRRSWTGRGKHSLYIESSAGPGHALVMMKTNDPVQMTRYAAWLDGRGAVPPLVTGVPAIAPGRVFLRVDLSEPGGYILFCPNSHQRTGMRGYQTGEFTQFTVR